MSFGERDVFSKINISVDSGCLVVTGRNGSGKSTLLKIIAGLLTPSSGEVVFKMNDEIISPDAKRDVVGLVAPDITFYDELSALENLRFFTRVRGFKIADDYLKSTLMKLGLEGRADDRLGSYSSGMRQRVKYAFALIHEPPILLLDEPSVNLDEAGTSVMNDIIQERREQGIVVIATNDRSELNYGDKVLELGA